MARLLHAYLPQRLPVQCTALNGRLRRLGCAGGRAAHLGVHATPHPYAGRRAGGGTAGAEPRCESDAATALTLRRVAMSEGDAEAARIAWVKRAVCDGLNLEEALRRRVAQPERQFLVRVAPELCFQQPSTWARGPLIAIESR